jgi:hypothetical protein
MSDAWIAPNRIDVVQRVNAARPGLILNAHAFTEAVACELRAEDSKWGRNGKRGNPNDPSEDALAWQNQAVPWGCSIVDIIGSAGSPDARPAWIDQTRRTAELGTVGVLVVPNCAGVPPPVIEPPPVTEPPPTTPPPATGPDEAEIRFRLLDAKLDALLVAADDAKHQQAADTDQIGKWMVAQAQGVIDAVTSTLGEQIAAIKCRFRW